MLHSRFQTSVATKVKQRRKAVGQRAGWRGNTVNLDEESSSAEQHTIN